MKHFLLKFLKVLIPFSLLLFLIHFTVFHFFVDVFLYYSLLSIYAFHIISTFLIYWILVFVHLKFKDKTGFLFMGASLVKMLAAVLFLLPMILSGSPAPLANITAFFVPYFLFLILETSFAVKLTNIK